MANIVGEKELKTDWPVEKGLVARTTKQTGRVSYLVSERGSKVLSRASKGIRW